MGNSRQCTWHESREFPAYRIVTAGTAVGGMIALT
jgi:hypothetical protein